MFSRCSNATAAAVLALGILAFGSELRAQDAESAALGDEAQDGHAFVAALLGYGSTNEPNVLGLSGGLRIGYTLPISLYVGALGMLHAGTNDPGEPDVNHYAHLIGGELGYDFGASGSVHLRPSLRAGAAYVVTPRDVDDSLVSPWLGLGAMLYGVFRPFHAGLDVEWMQMTRAVNNGDNSFYLGGFSLLVSAGILL